VAWGEERTQLELLSHSDPRAATFAVEGAQLRLRTIAVLDAARAVAEGERADAAAESRELMRWLVLLNAVAVAVVVGLFACLQGQAVRPLRRLARLEQRLRVDPRVRYGPPYPPGVIGRLTRALDHFAGQAERRRELELELRTDELTELYSRRAFFAELERAIERAEVSAADFLVCYVDVNGFKRINDNLGHAIGDQALVDVAQILREAFRAGDVVARLGGDEFAAIAFGVDVTAEPALRDRIEGNVEEFNAFEGRPYQLSLSLGIAGYHASATADALLQLADEAMYREKHGDRDAHEAA
jgi:diguanylate cyclase (GGDEF)-like protein